MRLVAMIVVLVAGAYAPSPVSGRMIQTPTITITLTAEEAEALTAMLAARPGPLRREGDTPASWLTEQIRRLLDGVVREYRQAQAQARTEEVRQLPDRAAKCAEAEKVLGRPIAGCER